jgi:hypothetical protein
MENVDDDGSASHLKDGVFRVTIDGKTTKVDVVRYTEGGEDKTGEAREKAAKRRKKQPKPKKPADEFHMPFLGLVQARYAFRIVETDPRDAARVRVSFKPTAPAENLIEGSAWVDARTGDILSIGASPSVTSLFVDFLNLQIELDAATPHGRAVSKITFEGSGGILFFRTHFRGTATFSDYRTKE